jgi:ankyrin repeat protein
MTPPHSPTLKNHRAVAELLLENGATSNAMNKLRGAPLLYAALEDRLVVFAWLLPPRLSRGKPLLIVTACLARDADKAGRCAASNPRLDRQW